MQWRQDKEYASAESDPEGFVSTQAITEDLGFTSGRELVEGMCPGWILRATPGEWTY